VASAQEPVGQSRSEGGNNRDSGEVQRADYEQANNDSRFPGGQPPTGEAFRGGGSFMTDNRSAGGDYR
jgi:hypothetical protein